MEDICIYMIQLGDHVNEGEINAASPLRVTAETIDFGLTKLTVFTDQSGLIGLLRYLHGLGLVILALSRAGAPDCALPAAKTKASDTV